MQEQVLWEKPNLIVLGRGTPEENVLSLCKNRDINGPSARTERCRVGALNASCARPFNS